jgi:hypothetical protein
LFVTPVSEVNSGHTRFVFVVRTRLVPCFQTKLSKPDRIQSAELIFTGSFCMYHLLFNLSSSVPFIKHLIPFDYQQTTHANSATDWREGPIIMSMLTGKFTADDSSPSATSPTPTTQGRGIVHLYRNHLPETFAAHLGLYG